MWIDPSKLETKKRKRSWPETVKNKKEFYATMEKKCPV